MDDGSARVTYKSDEADGINTGAAAAEEADDRQTETDRDEYERQVIDDDR